ncbi:hypothetical protein [Deinococcus koreensis]|uniref:Uncharacterized protein n=1 Tax=Deinococcus koreensis TaxID=2054903 RepID=A0A2K3UT89_9DEIO|nr:hypothetical protein [Deinococcus koreensis]PNY79751.1 hypothetical protein CVO96_17515 [Deinococcus koreensis]
MTISLFAIAARIVAERAQDATRGALRDIRRAPLDEWAVYQADVQASAAARAETAAAPSPAEPGGPCAGPTGHAAF